MARYSLVVAAALVLLTSITACGNIQPPGTPPSDIPGGNDTNMTLNGRVVASEADAETGLGDVLVTASRDGFARSAVTNAEGDFAIDGLSAGEWILSLSREGYIDTARPVQVGAEDGVTVAIAPVPAEAIEGMLLSRSPAKAR